MYIPSTRFVSSGSGVIVLKCSPLYIKSQMVQFTFEILVHAYMNLSEIQYDTFLTYILDVINLYCVIDKILAGTNR